MARIKVRWQVTEVFEAVFDAEDDLHAQSPSAYDMTNGIATFETEDLAGFEDNERGLSYGVIEREVIDYDWVRPGTAQDRADLVTPFAP